jgi:hypothetical protein
MEKFIEEWKAQAPPEPEVHIEPSIAPRSKQVVLPQDPDSVHKQKTKVSKLTEQERNQTPSPGVTRPLKERKKEHKDEES